MQPSVKERDLTQESRWRVVYKMTWKVWQVVPCVSGVQMTREVPEAGRQAAHVTSSMWVTAKLSVKGTHGKHSITWRQLEHLRPTTNLYRQGSANKTPLSNLPCTGRLKRLSRSYVRLCCKIAIVETEKQDLKIC